MKNNHRKKKKNSTAKVHFYVRRYPIDSIPIEDSQVEKWLLERWVEKDKLCEIFHQTGSFPNKIDEPFRHILLGETLSKNYSK